ncbi:MAG: hypothetical protein Q8R83_01485 [Legionellaceae bacterium]|nr:hypothetical protein [Legionellaceae bacterium]
MKKIITLIATIMGIISHSIAFADPWYTGPLLLTPAEITPLGDVNFEVSLGEMNSNGIYQQHFDLVSTPRNSSDQVNTQLIYGLADDVEVQINAGYMRNQNHGQSYSGLNDTLVVLGLGLQSQGESSSKSDITLQLGELFPTGRYEHLNSARYTTDATGGGSYVSSIGLSVQHLISFAEERYLNLYGNATLAASSKVRLKGLNAYGGTEITDGTITPGNWITFDLAAEYLFAKNWGVVMETYIAAQQASTFKGKFASLPAFIREEGNLRRRRIIFNRIKPSHFNIGNQQNLGHGNVAQFTLAPAVEYNISGNLGLIGGAWFSVVGKNIPEFFCGMLTLNMTW